MPTSYLPGAALFVRVGIPPEFRRGKPAATCDLSLLMSAFGAGETIPVQTAIIGLHQRPDLQRGAYPRTPDFAGATMMWCRHEHHLRVSSYNAVWRNRSISYGQQIHGRREQHGAGHGRIACPRPGVSRFAPSSASTGVRLAIAYGVPHSARDVFLDDDQTPAAIAKELARTEQVAWQRDRHRPSPRRDALRPQNLVAANRREGARPRPGQRGGSPSHGRGS
jgi:hypothetical protein